MITLLSSLAEGGDHSAKGGIFFAGVIVGWVLLTIWLEGRRKL